MSLINSPHQELNQVYNFSNIRFAQPPVGQLRWALPVPPTGRNAVVQNGSVGTICPQGTPHWASIAPLWLQNYLAGNASGFNYTQAQSEVATAFAKNPNLTFAKDPRETEDCLFLDVFVPKQIFDSAQSRRKRMAGRGAPVLVWQVNILPTD
jgi:carboxylesterase type B